MQKLERGQKPFFPYIKRLLIPYFIWSIIYDIVDFIAREQPDMKHFLAGCVYRFVITGTYEHFWFFLRFCLPFAALRCYLKSEAGSC